MSFRSDQLQSNEKIILETTQHWVILISPFIFAFLSTLIFGSLWFFLVFKLGFSFGHIVMLGLVPSYYKFIIRVIRRAHEEYIVTNLRVVKQEGVFSKSSFDSPIQKINNVFHKQSLFGRVWDYGEVGLETASEQGTTLFRYIPNPIQFKNAIISQQQSSQSMNTNYNPPVPVDSGTNGGDVPALLQKLGDLRDKGVITPEEFDSKKRDLLSRI